jgi:hypothetical protein
LELKFTEKTDGTTLNMMVQPSTRRHNEDRKGDGKKSKRKICGTQKRLVSFQPSTHIK